MGALLRRPWLALELHRLREYRRQGLTYAQCLRYFPGRSLTALLDFARRNGLVRPIRASIQARRRKVARWHAQGLAPYQMARRCPELKSPLVTLHTDHQRLGLVPHRTSRAETGRMGYRQTLDRHQQTPGEIRRERERLSAYLAGWPPCSRRVAFHLDLFYRLGPATAHIHGPRAGMLVRNAHKFLGFYRRAGLLVSRRGAGREIVYDLAPTVRARRQQILNYRSPAVPA